MELSKERFRVIWFSRVISAVAMLPFAMSALMKFRPNEQVIQGMSKMGMPESLLLPLGILEALCIVIYMIPQTAVLGAVLFTGYLGGAILTHLRVGDPIYMPLGLGGLIWLGIYLREPRLQALLPLVKPHSTN